jgi:hypothetical protein
MGESNTDLRHLLILWVCRTPGLYGDFTPMTIFDGASPTLDLIATVFPPMTIVNGASPTLDLVATVFLPITLIMVCHSPR